jgi:hypothetical protein
MSKTFTPLPIYDRLLKKIYAYYQTIWADKWREGIDINWLSNFNNLDNDELNRERVNIALPPFQVHVFWQF